MPHLSVVIPVYKAEKCLHALYERLKISLETVSQDFEIILVEDCGGDLSWKIIVELAENDSRVKGIQFSRNFGQHYGITAGLDYCNGDWVIVMDCDLQDPPEEIPRLYAKAQEGYDVVLARRGKRQDPPLKKITSWLFYRIFNYFTELDYDGEVGNFRIISRQVVENFSLMREQLRFFGGLIDWMGFPTASIDINHDKRYEGSLKLLFVFGFSGLITVILILIPIKDQLPTLISNFITYSRNLKSNLDITTIVNLLQSFKNSPILPVLTIFSLVFYQDKVLILTSLLALFIILNSSVYVHRLIYILPYLIVLLSGIYSQLKPDNNNIKRVKVIFLVLLLSYATSLSLIIRPIIGLGNASGRNLDILLDSGKNYIGQGQYKVWDSTYHFYQAGRSLGWKLYHPFRGLEDEKAREKFLDQLDYIIISQSLNDPFYPLIDNSKFKLKESMKIKINNQENKGLIYKITKYLKSQTTYGSYNLYSKF